VALATFGPEVVVMSGFMDANPGPAGATVERPASTDVAPFIVGLRAP
jgi:hypothetical protein